MKSLNIFQRWGWIVLGTVLWVGLAQGQDSLNVTKVGEISFLDYVYGVDVVGNYAYLANDNLGGLQVVDISNPGSPVQVGFYNTPGYATDVVVVGNYAYVADGYTGLRVVDISNPMSPNEVGFCALPGYACAIAVAGNYAYVAVWDNGLRVLEISNPTSPTEVGFYDALGVALDVVISGNYAYVAYDDEGLRLLDVSNPTSPTETGLWTAPPGGFASGVAVLGIYAYVATLPAGLRVVDVSNPSSPTEVGFYNTPGEAYGVAVAENHAYVADGSAGLRVVNVTSATSPIETGFYNTLGSARRVVVVGNYAYVADYNFFGIYDCSAAILPPVSITLSPINPPITIPASGGSFSFNVSVANSATTPQNTDAWIMTQLPSGSWYGPLLGPINLTLPASTSISRLRTQNVPASAPAGVYWYEGRVGAYPGTITDTSGFGFTKLGSGVNGPGAGEWANTGEAFDLTDVGGGRTPTLQPEEFGISVSPNPFNPSTDIRYQIPDARQVNLRVYDTAGRLVETLVEDWREAGEHQLSFDGSGLPSGVYLYRLQAGEQTVSGKLVLLK